MHKLRRKNADSNYGSTRASRNLPRACDSSDVQFYAHYTDDGTSCGLYDNARASVYQSNTGRSHRNGVDY